MLGVHRDEERLVQQEEESLHTERDRETLDEVDVRISYEDSTVWLIRQIDRRKYLEQRELLRSVTMYRDDELLDVALAKKKVDFFSS